MVFQLVRCSAKLWNCWSQHRSPSSTWSCLKAGCQRSTRKTPRGTWRPTGSGLVRLVGCCSVHVWLLVAQCWLVVGYSFMPAIHEAVLQSSSGSMGVRCWVDSLGSYIEKPKPDASVSRVDMWCCFHKWRSRMLKECRGPGFLARSHNFDDGSSYWGPGVLTKMTKSISRTLEPAPQNRILKHQEPCKPWSVCGLRNLLQRSNQWMQLIQVQQRTSNCQCPESIFRQWSKQILLLYPCAHGHDIKVKYILQISAMFENVVAKTCVSLVPGWHRLAHHASPKTRILKS